jgi:hypothetical protein
MAVPRFFRVTKKLFLPVSAKAVSVAKIYIRQKKSEKTNGVTSPTWVPTSTLLYDEDAPFITADGLTLFFASNGKLSTGGYDILRCDLTENGWSKPYNIGQPVNTPNDDKFYMVTGNGKKGYYSTQKEGGKGLHDIYVITPGMIGKPVKLLEVAGNVTLNDKPVEAEIEIRSTSNNNYKTQTYSSNSSTGKFLLNLPAGEQYSIRFNYKGFDPIVKNHQHCSDRFVYSTYTFCRFYSKDYKEKLQRKSDSLITS